MHKLYSTNTKIFIILILVVLLLIFLVVKNKTMTDVTVSHRSSKTLMQ